MAARALRRSEWRTGTAAGAVRRSHLRRCGPTSCACISPRSPTRCWSYCGAGACRARGWRGRNAARSCSNRRADPGQRAGRAAVVRRGLQGEPAPALLAAALQPSAPWRSPGISDCKRKQAPTTADLATLTRHLPGSDAPRNIARLSIKMDQLVRRARQTAKQNGACCAMSVRTQSRQHSSQMETVLKILGLCFVVASEAVKNLSMLPAALWNEFPHRDQVYFQSGDQVPHFRVDPCCKDGTAAAVPVITAITVHSKQLG